MYTYISYLLFSKYYKARFMIFFAKNTVLSYQVTCVIILCESGSRGPIVLLTKLGGCMVPADQGRIDQ